MAVGLVDRINEVLSAHLDRLRNRPFLDAAMAAAALVARADGEVTFAARSRVDAVLESVAQLQLYDPHDAVDRFNDFADAIAEDPEGGREQALTTIRPFAGAEEAGAIMRIAEAIATADGDRPDAGSDAIAAIAAALGAEGTKPT